MSTAASSSEHSVWDVRPENANDMAAVHDVVAAAFGDEPVVDLLQAMRDDTCWQDLSFVVTPADRSEVVVGHIAFTRGWVDAPDRLVEVLILSPMSIHPSWQHRGAGTALIRSTLDHLVSRPEPVIFLEGSPHYYGRLGFEPAVGHGFTPPSVRIPEAAFQLHWMPARARSPHLSGALVYPDVFWRHDAVGLR